LKTIFLEIVYLQQVNKIYSSNFGVYSSDFGVYSSDFRIQGSDFGSSSSEGEIAR